jgi:uncharacterized protein YecE (DUF72 family)
MTEKTANDLDRFMFRNLHPMIFMGTASDRYAGWLGQIYSEERYKGKATRRSKSIGNETVTEEVLPVASVADYFQHFAVLELDFTFYSLLLDPDLKPTQTYHVLETYQKYVRENDRLILKVPQALFAQKLWRGGKFIGNPSYLDAEIFIHRFYEPVRRLFDASIGGFLFEQEYQAKKERTPPREFASSLDQFLGRIPKDERYHIEVRTESLLSEPYFEVLEKHGVGQALSHWTWLPPLGKQFAKGAEKFLNSGAQCVVRLMTPRNMRYDEAYIKAFPFDRLIDSMISPSMVEDTVAVMIAAIQQGVHANVIINNRAGGNAPLIARRVAEKFTQTVPQEFR